MHKVRTDFFLRIVYIIYAYHVSLIFSWAKTGMIAILADGVIPVFYCLKICGMKNDKKCYRFYII